MLGEVWNHIYHVAWLWRTMKTDSKQPVTDMYWVSIIRISFFRVGCLFNNNWALFNQQVWGLTNFLCWLEVWCWGVLHIHCPLGIGRGGWWEVTSWVLRGTVARGEERFSTGSPLSSDSLSTEEGFSRGFSPSPASLLLHQGNTPHDPEKKAPGTPQSLPWTQFPALEWKMRPFFNETETTQEPHRY